MTHGGKRSGAGRPKGKGHYGEETKPIRLPKSLITDVLAYVKSNGHQLPLFSSKVSAGNPMDADDHIETYLNLHDHLVKNTQTTFLVRAVGQSMIGAGIDENDLLIVDRSLIPIDGKIVIAVVNGQLTVKRLCKKDKKLFLMPENEHFKPIEITEYHDVSIWGVVTSVIHAV